MRRNGFTLIEVLVALALAALVVLLAHRRLRPPSWTAPNGCEVARARLDRDANAHQWLVQAFGSLRG